jgi:hypothetical protein
MLLRSSEYSEMTQTNLIRILTIVALSVVMSEGSATLAFQEDSILLGHE